ncbi:hypothetical protein HAT92_00573 [Dickeya solani]|nr:hypothetical protein [Dickeya solani]QKO16700.1 hypothetical protein HAT92_00573 [Dickeya solani]
MVEKRRLHYHLLISVRQYGKDVFKYRVLYHANWSYLHT